MRLGNSPLVMEECGCLTFGSGSSICLDMTPPMVKIGWATDQVFSTDGAYEYWQVRFKPYVETAVTIKLTINIDRVYYNEITLDIPKFMTNVFVESFIYSDETVCINTGWQTQDIELSVITAMKFQDCYKTIIQSLCDFTNWTSTSAKILDECTASDSQRVTVYTYNPVEEDKIEYYSG
jgi:hypothetical protein